jgi:hypothetical protein
MSTLIFLDTGVVGKLIHPLVDQSKNRLAQNAESEVRESIREAIECHEWLKGLINEGYRLAICSNSTILKLDAGGILNFS